MNIVTVHLTSNDDNYTAPLSNYNDQYRIYGHDGHDRINANHNGNYLYGGDDNDTLVGGVRRDELYGGPGDDKLYEGNESNILVPARDKMVGGIGNDTYYVWYDARTGTGQIAEIIENVGEGHDQVKISLRAKEHHIPNSIAIHSSWNIEHFHDQQHVGSTSVLSSAGRHLHVTGDHTIDLSGYGGNDTLDGGSGVNVLWGGTGNDLLDGHGGHDVIHGEEGNDVIIAGAGSDTIDGGVGQDEVRFMDPEVLYGVHIDLGNPIPSGPHAGAILVLDNLIGAGSHGLVKNVESFVGSPFADKMLDGVGDDRLVGNAGADTITIGAGGTDTVLGGAGADTFVIDLARADALGGGRSEATILDFTPGVDSIQTSDAPTHHFKQGNGVAFRFAGGDEVTFANTTFADFDRTEWLFKLTDDVGTTATQSTLGFAGWTADRVIDKDPGTANHTGTANEWVRVDFAQDALIYSIDVLNRQDSQSGEGQRLNGATVEVWNEGALVQTVGTIANADGGSVHAYDLETPVVGDSVRISHSGQHLHVAEIDVIGEWLVNLTDDVGTTATQSTLGFAGWTADRVIDKDPGTANHTGTANEWVRVDFAQDALIYSIDVLNRQDSQSGEGQRLNGATVEVWNEGALVQTVGTIANADGGSVHAYDLETPVVGDSVRISHSGQHLHVAEIDVIGEWIGDAVLL